MELVKSKLLDEAQKRMEKSHGQVVVRTSFQRRCEMIVGFWHTFQNHGHFQARIQFLAHQT